MTNLPDPDMLAQAAVALSGCVLHDAAHTLDQRLLVRSSTRRDGEVASKVVRGAGIECTICVDDDMLIRELACGAGALMLVEEILVPKTVDLLAGYVADQPAWSDLPMLILTHEGANSPALRAAAERLGNITLMERPVRTAALVSAIRSAMKARQRQYQMRASQEKLLESEQRFKSLFEHHPDGIFVLDLHGYFISANKALEELTGYRLDDLAALPRCAPVMAEDVDIVTASFEAALHGTPQKFQMRVVRKDGKLIELEAAYLPLIIDGLTRGVHGIVRDVTQARDYERRIEYMATHDSLTGLANRYLLHARLQKAMERTGRDGRQSGVLFLDLNRFKHVNDSFGHDKGDLLLQEVAQRLQTIIRNGDTVARLGGDEFVIVLDGIDDIEEMATVADAVLRAVAMPVYVAGHELVVSTSIGGCVYPKDGANVETLLKHADLAMYQAKDLGSSSFRFYSPEMNTRILERLLTENALRRALDKNEFVLYYQPRVNVLTKRIVGVEALVRWLHPQKGLIAPSDFIPLAEEIGLIDAIGNWVLRAACLQSKRWQIAGLPPVKMAVNLSAHQLTSTGVAMLVAEVLGSTGLEPKYLELEITETSLMQNVDASLDHLMAIRESGVSISIDDFGTGYSSLAHLKQLPVDALKVDKSFIRDLTTDRDDAAIVAATIALADHMGLKVVAEGVTGVDQIKMLAERGCNEMQGYFFSRPLPVEAIESLVALPYRLNEDFQVLEKKRNPTTSRAR